MAIIASIVGTHCTGKSTLVEALGKVPGFLTVKSLTRSSVSPEERRLGNPTIEGQREILHNISEKMEELTVKRYESEGQQAFILDRSVVDFMAYTRIFAEQGYYREEEAFPILKTASRFVSWIDIIFYLAPEIPIIDDGVRSVDPVLRQQVDAEIKHILFWENIPGKPIVIPIRGTVEERVHEIRRWIDLFKTDPKRR